MHERRRRAARCGLPLKGQLSVLPVPCPQLQAHEFIFTLIGSKSHNVRIDKRFILP
jgi:hypothetical protein